MDFLLDTNVCIAAMRGNADVLGALASRHPEDMAVSMVTVYELEAGVALSRYPEQESERVRLFLSPLHVLPFDDRAARFSGRVRAKLQRSGNLIGPYDLMIAGHALAMELVLVTHNRSEFARVEGLRLMDWQG